MLPTGLVRSAGLLTHQGTPREEWGAVAIAGHLSQTAENAEDDGIRYVNRHNGALVVVLREAGTIHKSRQSFVEDLRRRIYKRATAPADGEFREGWEEGFRRDYDRIRHAIDRADLVRNCGPVAFGGLPFHEDLNGRRWHVDETLRDLPEAPEQRDSVRCTGPDPTVDLGGLHVDVLDALERIVAHREDLHEQFTAGWKQQQFDGDWGPRERKIDASKSHQWTAREGSDRPQFVGVGRFRPEEIDHEGLEGRRACTVPWIVFDLDGETWQECARLADRLCTRISKRVSARVLSDVQVVHTGGTSFHVYVPAGALGNRVYPNAAACKQALRRFADNLCGGNSELRDAIDNSVLDPTQVHRMIGSTYPNGNRVVACDAITFLGHGGFFLRGHSEVGRFHAYTLPDPTSTPFSPSLAALFERGPRRQNPRGRDSSTVAKQSSTGEYERALQVQYEGEKWGRDVNKPDLRGRNRAALTVSLVHLTYCPTERQAWRDTRAWNRDMTEPLPETELRTVFRHARKYRERGGA